MNVSFDGKRALVTGAAAGIGRAVAIRLLKCKANVVALDKNAQGLSELKAEFPEIEIVVTDLIDWNNTKSVVESVLPIDLLVNNAGMATMQPITEVTPEIIDSVFGVNIKSMFNVTQIIVANLLERKVPGAIVNVSSLASLAGFATRSVYSASKGAIDAFTRSLAQELGPHNIRVNAINPILVWTNMGESMWSDPVRKEWLLSKIPLNKFAQLKDVEDGIVFLLSENASMITGTCLAIDGGFVAC